MKLSNNLDFQKWEGRNFRAHNNGTAPSSPVTGQLWYDTAVNTLKWWNGTDWVSASGGTPSDATTTSKGIVQLAGDLAGTAASPQIAAGAVDSNEVSANIKDPAAGTAGLRTLGTGAAQAFPGNGRIDQLAAPTADVGFNSRKITALADPTAAQDAATKNYVDLNIQGMDQISVRAASTANLTLSGTQTVDGVALAAGDTVLVKNQTAPAENGVYVVAAGAWTRHGRMNSADEIDGKLVVVEDGAQSGTLWLTTSEVTTLDTDAITFTQFNSAADITAGDGLTKSGNDLSVNVDNSSIELSADALRVKAGGITEAMLADDSVDLDDSQGTVTGTLAIGNGGTGQTTAKTARETGLAAAGYYSATGPGSGSSSIAITQATHGLRASRGLLVQVQDEATGEVEIPDISVAASGDVTITFGASQTANSKRVTIIG